MKTSTLCVIGLISCLTTYCGEVFAQDMGPNAVPTISMIPMPVPTSLTPITPTTSSLTPAPMATVTPGDIINEVTLLPIPFYLMCNELAKKSLQLANDNCEIFNVFSDVSEVNVRAQEQYAICLRDAKESSEKFRQQCRGMYRTTQG